MFYFHYNNSPVVQDWRTKGAYRAVDLDAPSSDDPAAEAPSEPPLHTDEGTNLNSILVTKR